MSGEGTPGASVVSVEKHKQELKMACLNATIRSLESRKMPFSVAQIAKGTEGLYSKLAAIDAESNSPLVIFLQGPLTDATEKTEEVDA